MEELLTIDEVADLLGVTVGTLRNWRFKNRGVPSIPAEQLFPPGYGERVRGLKNASRMIRDYLGDNSAYYSTLSRLIAAGEISALNADDKGGSSDYNGTQCPTTVNGQCVWGDSNAW